MTGAQLREGFEQRPEALQARVVGGEEIQGVARFQFQPGAHFLPVFRANRRGESRGVDSVRDPANPIGSHAVQFAQIPFHHAGDGDDGAAAPRILPPFEFTILQQPSPIRRAQSLLPALAGRAARVVQTAICHAGTGLRVQDPGTPTGPEIVHDVGFQAGEGHLDRPRPPEATAGPREQVEQGPLRLPGFARLTGWARVKGDDVDFVPAFRKPANQLACPVFESSGGGIETLAGDGDPHATHLAGRARRTASKTWSTDRSRMQR